VEDPGDTTRLLNGAGCRIIRWLDRVAVGSQKFVHQASGKVSAGGFGVR